MAPQTAPIVITLKKRSGPTRRSEPDHDEKSEELESRAAADPTGPLAPSKSRSRDRSRSRRSAKKSRSRSRSSNALAKAALLNTTALEDIFARFHGNLDNWLKEESDKLERTEARGKTSAEDLQKCTEKVCGFFRDHASSADLGPDASGEGFTTRALPHFLELIDEDRRALQEAAGFLSAYAGRHFPNSSEVASFKADSSPLPMLKTLLRLASSASAPKVRGGGGGGGERGGDRGGERGTRKKRGRTANGNSSGNAPAPGAERQLPPVGEVGSKPVDGRGRSHGGGPGTTAAADGGCIRSESVSSIISR